MIGGHFCLIWVTEFACDDQGNFWQGYKGAQSASEVTFVLGSTSVALRQGLAPVALGQDSTVASTHQRESATGRYTSC